MISNSDFEKLWFLYKIEGASKGVSINAFCLSRGVNYNELNKWFRKMHKSIVPVEIEGALEVEFKESKEPYWYIIADVYSTKNYQYVPVTSGYRAFFSQKCRKICVILRDNLDVRDYFSIFAAEFATI